MTKRPPTHEKYGYQSVDEWLAAIAARRAAMPKKAEMKAAVEAARAEGMFIDQIASKVGLSRNALYDAGYVGKGGYQARKAKAKPASSDQAEAGAPS